MYPETGRQINPEPSLDYGNGFMEGAGFGCIITIILILLLG